MRIAVSSEGSELDDRIDQRFGRCPYFLIIEIEEGKANKFEAVANKGAAQGHGAGIRAAEQVAELMADAVITGQLGPNASGMLKRLGIKAYSASGKINDAISGFADGKLEIITEAAEPHQGIAPKEKNKDERIFFPLLNNRGTDSEISEHFGHAPFFGVYDVKKKELKIIENDLDHADSAKSPIDQIQEAVDPTTIFAKGIGGRAVSIISEKGLSLKTGDYKTLKEAIANLEKLEDQTKSCGFTH